MMANKAPHFARMVRAAAALLLINAIPLAGLAVPCSAARKLRIQSVRSSPSDACTASLARACEEGWSGTVESVITGRSEDSNDVYDLGKKTETTDNKIKIRVKIDFGEASENVDYIKNVQGKTVGKQFCGTNAQPQYADYSATETTAVTGSGSGAAEVAVNVNEAAKNYSIQIRPQFEYDLKTEYKQEIGSQCPGNQSKGDQRSYSVKTSSGILIAQIPFDSANANKLIGTKTDTLIDGSSAVYTWNLTRCQTCEFTARDANTRAALSREELKRYGYQDSGGSQTIRTGAGQRLEFAMADGSILRAGPNTEVEFNPCDLAYKKEGKVSIKVILGKIWAHVEKVSGREVEVTTERALVGVRGTTFEVAYSPRDEVSYVHVIEGSVFFGDLNFENKITVDTGKFAIMKGDAAPQFTVGSKFTVGQ